MAKRDYDEEYRKYHKSAKSKKDRASRNNARRAAEREGRARKGDGKDIDHKDGNPRNNSKGNLRLVSRSKNRSDKRKITGRKQNRS